MKLVTTSDILAKNFGDEECVRILARAGFDAIDWSFFGMETGQSVWCEEGFRERALRIREVGKECGIGFAQAHAPFPSSGGEEPYDTQIRKWILRAMEVAALMGVENIIVHPRQHLTYAGNEERLFAENMDFYRSLLPYCEEYGIRVCVENMWQYDNRRKYIVDSVCSCPQEFNRLLDELNSPWIVGCLDLGHSALVGREPEDFIRAMGNRRLRALHVHDVNYIADCHTLPFMESLHWEEITRALAEIGYEGNFTFEADSFFINLPPELMPEASIFMEKTGRYLMKRIAQHMQELQNV